MKRFTLPSAQEAATGTDLATLQVFEKILRHNVEAILITDTQGTIEWANQTFSHLTGHNAESVFGQNIGFLFADGENEYDALYPKLDEAHHHEAETRIFRRDGSHFPARLTLSAVRSDADMITHYVLEFSDITEFRRAQSELELRSRELARSNTELEQFAYVASHDLQEPLRMVASYTQLLGQRYKGRLDEDEDADEFIHYAVDGATRMQTIINDLLALSRVNTRNTPLEVIPATAALERALSNLRLIIDEKGVQLTQLFQNLIANAIKFCRTPPVCVEIGARAGDGEWIFHVRDNGIGIAPEHFDRIFLLFQRLHGKQDYPGNGIGLTICKKIIDRHGGRIWIESTPGTGATFYFSLPDTATPRSS